MRSRPTATGALLWPLRALLMALVCFAAAHAAEPPQPTPEAIALDTAIQGLKDEALELNAEMQGSRTTSPFPATARWRSTWVRPPPGPRRCPK
jgi:hypothetical protein